MSSGDRIAVTLRLTQAEADALYFWTQSHDCPNYWETPLDPVGRALARWFREGSPDGWSNR